MSVLSVTPVYQNIFIFFNAFFIHLCVTGNFENLGNDDYS